MATREELLKALQAADAAATKGVAGAANDATALARAIQEMDAQPQPTPAERIGSDANEAVRGIGYAGKGFNDSVAETLGFLPQVLAGGIKRVTGVDLAPRAGYAGAIKHGLDYVGLGGPQGEPQGAFERGAYGAGRGVGDAASVMVPGAAIARAAPVGSLIGRVAQGVAAQPLTQAVAGGVGGGVGEATGNPYYGMAAGLTVPSAAGIARRIVSPVASTLTAEQARLAQVAAQEGIPLRPGQQTGSRSLQSLESTLGTMPISGGMAKAAEQTQREAFNRAVLRRAGISSNVATPDVIDAQHAKLGRDFERLSRGTTVQLDRPFLNDLWATVSEYTKNLKADQKGIFQAHVNDIIDQVRQPGGMTGETYQKARSTLGRLQKNFAGSDPELSKALEGLQSSLDDAAGRNIPASMRDQWHDVRTQYRNLLAIDRVISSASAGSAAGNISPAQLWPAIRQQTGNVGMARGRGDLNDLARVGQAFIKDQIPNSGTPERTMWMHWLTGGGLFGGGALAAGANPLTAAGAGAAALVLPAAVQKFIQSPKGQAWLTNQVARGIGPRVDAPLLGSIAAGRALDVAQRPLSGNSAFGGP